jgi:hypothetical protein
LKINPVVSILHLEPALASPDNPYKGQFSQTALEEPKPQRILHKRIVKHGYRSGSAEYLVKFTGHSVEND